MTAEPGTEDMAVVATTETEFEAQTKAVVLRSEGIDSTVMRNAPSWIGHVSINPTAHGVSIWVRRRDLERAQGVLEQAVADSVDLDWDEVNVGEREDHLRPRAVGSTPWLWKVSSVMAWGVIILGAVAFLVWLGTLLL